MPLNMCHSHILIAYFQSHEPGDAQKTLFGQEAKNTGWNRCKHQSLSSCLQKINQHVGYDFWKDFCQEFSDLPGVFLFFSSNSSPLWWQLSELDSNHCFFVCFFPWLVVKVVNSTKLEPFDCVHPFQITFWPSSAVRTRDLISSETHQCPLNDDSDGYMRAWRRICCQRARKCLSHSAVILCELPQPVRALMSNRSPVVRYSGHNN